MFLGAGGNTERRLDTGALMHRVDTLDITGTPTILWDLNHRPLPISDSTYDEIHAYEILEHVGRQGDWQGFFEEFDEYHRVLKPGGIMLGSVPALTSEWLWADPGHTRAISSGTLSFLVRANYGKPPMTDYRHVYKSDFKIVHLDPQPQHLWFGLQALK